MPKTTERVAAANQAPEFFHAPISILGYREDAGWVALALEMDLRGYGATFDEALNDLRDLVVMQIDFALSQEKPEMIWKDAESMYFRMYEAVRREELRAAIGRRKSSSSGYQTGGLQVPAASLIASHHAGFARADA